MTPEQHEALVEKVREYNSLKSNLDQFTTLRQVIESTTTNQITLTADGNFYLNNSKVTGNFAALTNRIKDSIDLELQKLINETQQKLDEL